MPTHPDVGEGASPLPVRPGRAFLCPAFDNAREVDPRPTCAGMPESTHGTCRPFDDDVRRPCAGAVGCGMRGSPRSRYCSRRAHPRTGARQRLRDGCLHASARTAGASAARRRCCATAAAGIDRRASRRLADAAAPLPSCGVRAPDLARCERLGHARRNARRHHAAGRRLSAVRAVRAGSRVRAAFRHGARH